MIHGNPSAVPLRWNGKARSLKLAVVQRITVAQAGWLTIDSVQVWLTRVGLGEDMVLAGGARTLLSAGEVLVAEPWLRGTPAQLSWSACGAGSAGPLVCDAGARLASQERPSQRLSQPLSQLLAQPKHGWVYTLWRAAGRCAVRLQLSPHSLVVA